MTLRKSALYGAKMGARDVRKATNDETSQFIDYIWPLVSHRLSHYASITIREARHTLLVSPFAFLAFSLRFNSVR